MNAVRRFLIFFLFLTSLLSSCRREACLEGEGDNFKKSQNTAPFHTILTEIPANLLLTHDTNLTNGVVEISAQNGVHERISLEVSNGVLRIFFNDCLDGHKDIGLHIQSAEMRNIIAGSPLTISTSRAIQSDSLSIQTLQSCNADIFYAGTYLKSEFLASGAFTFAGHSRHFVCNNEANMNLNSFDLIADTVDLSTSSSNDLKVYAHKLLKVNIESRGGVLYRGFPEIEQSGNGAGELLEDN